MDRRVEVEDTELTAAMALLAGNLTRRVREKGRGAFISDTEIRGAIDEEMDEVKEAMHDNDRNGTFEELMDLAVGCIFGVASLMAIERKGAAAQPGKEK